MHLTRARLIMDGVALAAGMAGWQMLVRPARTRRLLSLGDSEAATYMLRLFGAILFAFGLTLLCFSIAFAIATA
jgi:hypothetical protein